MTTTDTMTAARKSSFSDEKGECLVAGRIGQHRVGIEDSKRPDGPRLVLRREQFAAFLAGIKATHLT